MTGQTAVIIGGGPAGLTAAYELLARTGMRPIVLEATDDVGGISRTVEHRGNRIDIGGHRFFSKSDRVVNWWLEALPLEEDGAGDPDTPAMMVRSRVSRILYGGKLFQYPLSMSADTVRKLGLLNTARFGLSYLWARLRPIAPEKSLEDFIVNRFGRQLYARFFEEYTEKVWGVPCRDISPEWGAQRIKGLSITKVLLHALKRVRPGDLAQKGVETSLIERFMYPKLGPGQLWRTVADKVRAMGGEVRLNQQVTALRHEGGAVREVAVRDRLTGEETVLAADAVISTMPIKDLVAGLEPAAPADIGRIADGLVYRDFLTVGLLVDRLELGGGATGRDLAEKVPDNWIYVQEPGVKVGRLQIFNNWSPHMVADPERVWIGLEYFCNEGDDLWEMADPALLDLAVDEVVRLGLVTREAVRDRMAYRMPKAYPAYFGTYGELPALRSYVDAFANLYLVGRNGMHRYNNQDHSMLTAMAAVDAILGQGDKAEIWSVNTEQEYHEAKAKAATVQNPPPVGRPVPA
jgi:protoporphyrinogen oxidase